MPNILSAVPSKKEKLPLSVTHPDLAKEADGWDPNEYIAGGHTKRQWKCPNGHSYLASISNRVRNHSGCPYCSGLRALSGFNDLATTHPSLAKQAFGWDPTVVRAGSHRKLTWLCELGHQYSASPEDRTKYNDGGCRYCSRSLVLPGFNDLATTHPELIREVYKWDPTIVLAGSNKKMKWQCPQGHIFEASPSARTNTKKGPSRAAHGTRCPICTGKKVLAGFNDLKTTHSLLASEAYGWDPATVSAGSNKSLNWQCKFGHIWKSSVNNRAKQELGCPICSGQKVLPGFNDLATTHPELAEQAVDWDAKLFNRGSGKKMKWQCSEGHLWKAVISNRALQGKGCPTCAESGFDPNQPAFLYLLAQEDWGMLQIGITNNINRRLEEHSRNRWSLQEVRGPIDGHLTRQWETAILRMLKAKGADLSNEKIAGKFDGYSEAWSKSTFEVKSIKELMRLTEEFEG